LSSFHLQLHFLNSQEHSEQLLPLSEEKPKPFMEWSEPPES
jgi:hypothetical protein